LQVEHPVTELVTGLDLVQWQLRIAAGEHLSVSQNGVEWRGHAIECRVYAEDPDHDFLPFPGKIENLSEPSGPGIRLDSGVYPGWNVPLEYDPLLAKLAAWGPTRADAIRRLDRALAEYVLTGIRTNVQFFREILADPEFAAGRLSTAFLESFFTRRIPRVNDPNEQAAAELVATALAAPQSNGASAVPSQWLRDGLGSLLR
jgi:acetyl-CoA carboxylase biotin carboxylase subunit